MTLGELLELAGDGLPGVDRATGSNGATIWSRGERAFATLSSDGAAAEFNLEPAVAMAAATTPDTVPSPRGLGWVRFQPGLLDAHDADRASAWFASAYRRASSR